jgi:hypothetical protein
VTSTFASAIRFRIDSASDCVMIGSETVGIGWSVLSVCAEGLSSRFIPSGASGLVFGLVGGRLSPGGVVFPH